MINPYSLLLGRSKRNTIIASGLYKFICYI